MGWFVADVCLVLILIWLAAGYWYIALWFGWFKIDFGCLVVYCLVINFVIFGVLMAYFKVLCLLCLSMFLLGLWFVTLRFWVLACCACFLLFGFMFYLFDWCWVLFLVLNCLMFDCILLFEFWVCWLAFWMLFHLFAFVVSCYSSWVGLGLICLLLCFILRLWFALLFGLGMVTVSICVVGCVWLMWFALCDLVSWVLGCLRYLIGWLICCFLVLGFDLCVVYCCWCLV